MIKIRPDPESLNDLQGPHAFSTADIERVQNTLLIFHDAACLLLNALELFMAAEGTELGPDSSVEEDNTSH